MNIKFVADVYEGGAKLFAVGDVVQLGDLNAKWIRRGAAVEAADNSDNPAVRRGRPPKIASG